MESEDAGLGGIGVFEDEPHHDGAMPASDTAGSAFLAPNGHHDDGSVAGGGYKAPSHYDYDESEDYPDNNAAAARDDSTIQSADSGATPPPPRVPKSTGNPLKDMLNAQIVHRGSVSGAPAAKTAHTAWGDEASDEEDADRPMQQKSAADVVGRAAMAGKAQHGDDQSVSSAGGAGKGRTAGTAAAPAAAEEEEDDEGDLFAATDDPFGLFGTTKPSAFSRVSTCWSLHSSLKLSALANGNLYSSLLSAAQHVNPRRLILVFGFVVLFVEDEQAQLPGRSLRRPRRRHGRRLAVRGQ